MIILYQFGSKAVNDIWCGTKVCEKCGQEHDVYLVRKNFYFSLFWIPIMTFSVGWYKMCAGCGEVEKMKRREYRALREEMTKKMENGEFPARIIENDFTPKKLKVTLKLILLILAIVFGVMTSFGIITMPLGVTLIYFAFYNYSFAKKKQKKYKELFPDR